MSQNPLISAYKKPAMYVSLPSGGKYYEPKPKLSVDGELAIYPMTARDELITKTPDALFNGEATIALIESCCPDIENPRQIPVNDLLVLMLAIRQASYGNNLDVDINCPKCDYMNQMSVDAGAMLASAQQLEHDNTVTLKNGFIVYAKPFNLEDRTILQIQQVKQQKMITALADESLTDEDRTRKFGETFVELAELTVELIANSIVYVQQDADAERHEDKEIIREWLQSISKTDYEQIRDRIETLSDSGLNTKVNATCQDCGNEWQTDIDLDIANFFAGS